MKINLLRPCVLGVTLCLGTSVLVPVAHAKPKAASTRLEIWPGQRALVVLPLVVNPGFLSTGDEASTTSPADSTPVAAASEGSSALATAIVPLLSPQLSDALKATGKFSVVRPYKFDPILRRAVAEQGVTEDAASGFIESPSLSSAQTVLPLLRLDQTGMVAQVTVQSLRVGGTAAAPTVQMTVRGDLYEATSPTPFRSITVTSRPFPGATPEDRLRAAAGQAFADVAAAFVEPPSEFDLPLPTGAAAGMMTGTTPGATTSGGITAQPSVGAPTRPSGMGTTPGMAMPMNPVAPQAPNGVMGAPIAPQLPGSTPPLGVNVPDQD